MTLLLRRKRRTTAPRTTRLRTAVKAALLAVLVGGPASAQPQPYGQPQYRPGQPGVMNRPAQPTLPPRGTTGGLPGARAPGQPAADPAPPGSAGRVMYFQKPANALALVGDTTPPEQPAVADPAPTQTPAPARTGSGVETAGTPSPSAFEPVPARPVAAYEPDTGVEAPPVPPLYTTATQPDSRSDKQPLPRDIKKIGPQDVPLPGRERVFMMLDDEALERDVLNFLRAQTPQFDPTARFPPLPPTVPAGTPYVVKKVREDYPPRKELYEAAYVVHRRLHFEEKNAERYGWDLGFIQPFVSTLYFYKDSLLWPNSLASGVEVGFWDTSAGKCLPGSPVPYNLYPPGLTVTGMLFETGLVTGTAFWISPVRGAPVVPGR